MGAVNVHGAHKTFKVSLSIKCYCFGIHKCQIVLATMMKFTNHITL